MNSPLVNYEDEGNSNEIYDQIDLINLPQPVKICDKKIHKCDVCSKQFSRKDHLTKHGFIHLKPKPFSCEVCLKTFAREDQMEHHLKTHLKGSEEIDLKSGKTETKTHKCTICLKEFSRKDIMKKHMFTHSGIKPFSCEVCFKAFGRRDHMEKHSRTHMKDKSLSDSLFELMSYQQQMSNVKDELLIGTEAEEPYFCEDGEQGNMNPLYETHHGNSLSEANVNVSKKSINIFQCTICSKQFFRKDIYKKHMFIHSGIKPFSCEICSKAFGRKDYLKKHMLTHSKERRKTESIEVLGDVKDQRSPEFSEDDTSRDIKFEVGEENLIESRRFHTANTNIVLPVDSKSTIKSENIFQCTICSKQFFRKDHFKKHLHTHSGIKPFSCEICSKAFGRRDYLKKHLLTHSKEKRRTESIAVPEVNVSEDYQWNLMEENEFNGDDNSINNTFMVAEQDFMRNHLRESIENDYFQSDQKLAKTETFKCTLCSKEFSRKDVLKKHMFTHSGIKPFSCEICSKAFGRKDYLKKHSLSHTKQRKTHSDPASGVNVTEDGKFHCSSKDANGFKCGKYFTSRWSLQKHIKTHSNFELYKCDICSKRFSKKSSLIKHLHRHFPSNKDDLKCKVCSKEFSRKDRFNRHMNIHSDIRSFSCMVCSKTFRRKHHMQRHLEGHNSIKVECD